MQKFITGSPKRILIISLATFFVTLMAMVSVGYAWFSISASTQSSAVAAVGEVEADYSFYVFLDSTKQGNATPLISNQCASSSGNACYWLIENTENPLTEPVYIFGSTVPVFPGDKFSFALSVTNTGDVDSNLEVDLKNLISSGFDQTINKIQVAFSYQVTKIAYVAESYESVDIKSNQGILINTGHFTSDNDIEYVLTRGIPLIPNDRYKCTAVVYFDLYFDPTITGYDGLGAPENNSNAFENQIFTISQIGFFLVGQ